MLRTTTRGGATDNDTEQQRKLRMLLSRIKSLETSGLLTQQDGDVFRELLQTNKSEYYIRQIHKKLDQMIKENPKMMPSLVDHDELDPPSLASMSQTTDDSYAKYMTIKAGQEECVSTDEQSRDSVGSSLLDFVNDKENEKVILEPHDLWSGSICFNEQQLQELFIEMCFFARLGYVQPPCCLKCTYKQTMLQNANGGNVEQESCSRWVVWRKDAETLLHPNLIDGNIIIVQCNVAGKLLKGLTVEGRRWDTVRKCIMDLA